MSPTTPLQEPVIRSFDTLDQASRARAALVAAGLPADAIEIRVIQDEAGPVEGNFLIGNGHTAHGGAPGAVLAGPEVPYDQNFARTVNRGSNLLLVNVYDPARRAQAEQALQAFMGVDPVAASR